MAKTSVSGPQAGAYIMLPVCGAGANGDVMNLDAAVPDGMKMRLFGAIINCTASSSGSIIVGTTADTNGYLEAKTFVANSTLYFPFDGTLGTSIEVDDADDLLVTLGGTVTGARVDLVGYVTEHTTDLDREGK